MIFPTAQQGEHEAVHVGGGGAQATRWPIAHIKEGQAYVSAILKFISLGRSGTPFTGNIYIESTVGYLQRDEDVVGHVLLESSAGNFRGHVSCQIGSEIAVGHIFSGRIDLPRHVGL